MITALVMSAIRIAWNLMYVTLKGADFTITIALSNPEDFEDYTVGESVDITIVPTPEIP